MDYDFSIVDVFAEQPFCGNQLAVFTDARDIPAELMQSLAREFNFAESTFVLPATDDMSSHQLRIFTPKAELPFAGHPILGTAAVLAHHGMLNDTAQGGVVLQTASGPVDIAVKRVDRRFSAAFRINRVIEQRDAPSAANVADALSVDPGEIIDVQCASAGLPFCFVELTNRGVVDKARLDQSAWLAGLSGTWAPHLYLFAADPSDRTQLYARMFAPALGVNEDPATGSAAAALAGLFAHHAGQSDRIDLQITQGVALGRPSTIHASGMQRGDGTIQIEVGGDAVVLGKGVITL
jgi:trans-2,3-dihydro-3-hydroxyanthranilate isomerase